MNSRPAFLPAESGAVHFASAVPGSAPYSIVDSADDPSMSQNAAAPATQGVSRRRILAAWGVHAFTMSGLIWASLATVALIEGRIAFMWLWLGVALIVDGVDGTMARKACVKECIPWFDGVVLDVIIDYLTWTFIPAFFMYLYLPFGSRWMGLAMMLVALVSSVFCYANEGEKSSDSYFVGFPAAWNVVAAAMYVLGTPAFVNILVTLALAVLTLVPLHYTHPFRVKKLRSVNIFASIVWVVSTAVLIARYPDQPLWALIAFGASAVCFLLTGIARTWRARSDEELLTAD